MLWYCQVIDIFIYRYICVYMSIYSYMYRYIHVFIYIYIRICTCIHVYIYVWVNCNDLAIIRLVNDWDSPRYMIPDIDVCAFIHVHCMYIYVCLYIFIYIYKNLYTLIYIYTWMYVYFLDRGIDRHTGNQWIPELARFGWGNSSCTWPRSVLPQWLVSFWWLILLIIHQVMIQNSL